MQIHKFFRGSLIIAACYCGVSILQGNFKPMFLETAFNVQEFTPRAGKITFSQTMELSTPAPGTFVGKPYTSRNIRMLEYGTGFPTSETVLTAVISTQAVCSDAVVPTAATECLFPFQIQGQASSKISHYQHLAGIAEKVWECRGLKAIHVATHSNLRIGIGQRPQCEIKSQLPDGFKFGVRWSENDPSALKAMSFMSQHVSSCLSFKNETRRFANDMKSESCQCVEKCSFAWLTASGFMAVKPSTTQIRNIVLTQQRCMRRMFSAETWQHESGCIKFPKIESSICGGLQSYGDLVNTLEPLYRGGRNLMFHERGSVIDFVSYLPLPSVPGFNASVEGRKALLVVGANGFFRATKFLIDMYSPYWQFDDVFLFEPDDDGMKIPAQFRDTSKFHFVKGFINVGGRNKDDAIIFIQNNFQEKDFVVVMFDVDEGTSGATMEWGFLADLTGQGWKLVDELFIELHMYKPDIGWVHKTHSSQEQFDVLSQLRDKCGFAVHAWP